MIGKTMGRDEAKTKYGDCSVLWECDLVCSIRVDSISSVLQRCMRYSLGLVFLLSFYIVCVFTISYFVQCRF